MIKKSVLGALLASSVSMAALAQGTYPSPTFSALTVNHASATETQSITSTGLGALTNLGGAIFGVDDYRKVTILPSVGGFNSGSAATILVNRVTSKTTDDYVYKQNWSITHSGANVGIQKNMYLSTSIGVGANPGETWGWLSSLHTNANNDLTGVNHVGGYTQVVRDSVPGGGKVGVNIEGHVIEARSLTGQPSSVDGKIRVLELDLAASGLDDSPLLGREVLPIVVSKGQASDAAPTISSIIGVYGTSGYTTTIGDVFHIEGFTQFSGSVLRSTAAVQMAGANAIWLGTNHRIALDTSAATALSSNATTITATGALTATGAFIANSGATNGLSLSGTTIVPTGSGNPNININSLGTGIVNFKSSNGNSMFRVNNATSPVNYLMVTPSATGGNVRFESQGTDTDVGITLLARGAGIFNFTSPVQVKNLNLTGTYTWSGADVAGVLTNGLYMSASYAGSTSSTSGQVLETHNIASDSLSQPGAAGGTTGVKWIHNVTTGADQSRRAIETSLNVVSALTAVNPTIFFTSAVFGARGNVNVGGTLGSEKGTLFGINPNVAISGAAATFWTGLVGQEIDLAIENGAMAPRNKYGFAIELTTTDTAQGIDNDVAMTLYSQPTAGATNNSVGWRRLIQLAKNGSQWPLDTTNGVILTTYPNAPSTSSTAVARPQSAALGIDLWAVNFSTAAWRSSGIVLGNASAKVGPANITAISGGAQIDMSGYSAAIASVATASVGYAVGDQLYDNFGGVINVDTINGSGGITAAHYVITPYSTGAGAATTTVKGGTAQSQAAVFNLTWTAQTALTLGTSSQKLGFYGATAIVKATPVGACAGNTGCQALRDAMGNLGLINTGSISN